MAIPNLNQAASTQMTAHSTTDTSALGLAAMLASGNAFSQTLAQHVAEQPTPNAAYANEVANAKADANRSSNTDAARTGNTSCTNSDAEQVTKSDANQSPQSAQTTTSSAQKSNATRSADAEKKSNDDENSDASQNDVAAANASTTNLLALVGQLNLEARQDRGAASTAGADAGLSIDANHPGRKAGFDVALDSRFNPASQTDAANATDAAIKAGLASARTSGSVSSSDATAALNNTADGKTALAFDGKAEAKTSSKFSAIDAQAKPTLDASSGQAQALTASRSNDDATKTPTTQAATQFNPSATPNAETGNNKAMADALALAKDSLGLNAVNGSNAAVTTNAGNAANVINLGASQALTANPAYSAVAAGALDASRSIAARVGSTRWDNAVGQQVLWMVGNNQHSASLSLNPPDLGPLQVVLNVSNDQTHASFVAAQPEVRQALEAAMPRLRDMMQNAGVNLGQTNVSANANPNTSSQQQAFSQREGYANGTMRPGIETNNNDSNASLRPITSTRVIRGVIDTFA